MNLRMTHVDVWAAEIDDQPGGLATTMRAIADRGANLEFVEARREPEEAGKGVVYLSSLRKTEEIQAAQESGLRRATELFALRVEGTDEAGLGAKLTHAIAEVGVNLQSMTSAVVGHRFVCYLGFDSAEDLAKAENALKILTEHHWHLWPHRAAAHVA